MDLATHLIELERCLHTASTRQNAANLLSDDFREFGASGRIWDKPTMLVSLAAEEHYPITSDHFVFQELAPGLALLTYTATTPTRRSLRSSLWRLEDGHWRVLFHQGTVIPNP
ncbi:DUF4440 domain-containing protein [Granulicella sp. 5B5]|uniref:nuclear transport factor 2 family protein n=1 Tax=Granulicella sp. 5B5 TaxID=1617967 RepID=UPI0015F6DBA6|nr:DUF4440 domain-containing protein [Granulicella sp. 5B5]QMV19177.1 DUF4440 domain-containing protein [Granulicella sp. 5B5]